MRAACVEFTTPPAIAIGGNGAASVFAADLDGDLDAISVVYYDDKIAWSPNLGRGVFDDGFDSDANNACWSSAAP